MSLNNKEPEYVLLANNGDSIFFFEDEEDFKSIVTTAYIRPDPMYFKTDVIDYFMHQIMALHLKVEMESLIEGGFVEPYHDTYSSASLVRSINAARNEIIKLNLIDSEGMAKIIDKVIKAVNDQVSIELKIKKTEF